MPRKIDRCPCCGECGFEQHAVLWPELIEAWELSAEEAAYVDRQQGLRCTHCGASLRSMTLADALLTSFKYDGLLTEFVRTPDARRLKVLEVNPAGELTPFLTELPGHVLTRFPEVDMQRLPFAEGSFDVVIHSDTLEHVPDPLQGLQECCRVLRPGGRCCFTVPMIVGRLSRSCAGRAPSHHGGKTNPADCLVHTEFGADAWSFPLQAGFESCRMHAIEFPTSVALIADKRHSPRCSGVPQNSSNPTSLLREMLQCYAMSLQFAQDADVVDATYDGGAGSALLATRAKHVVCIEWAPPKEQRTPSRQNLRFAVASDQHIPVGDGTADLVVSFSTPPKCDPAVFISEVRRALRPDGVAILTVPVEADAGAHWLEIIEREFRQSITLGQRLIRGSVVGPLHQSAAVLQFFSYQGDECGVHAQAGISRATSFLTLMTNRDEPLPHEVSVFETPDDVAGPPAQYWEVKAQVRALEASTSWRVTAPLRALSNWWHGRT